MLVDISLVLFSKLTRTYLSSFNAVKHSEYALRNNNMKNVTKYKNKCELSFGE